MDNKNQEIVNGANPSIIWTQYMDFLATYAGQMKSRYVKRMRDNNPFTWADLDVMNKEIHDKLDYLMTWDENVNQKDNIQQPSEINESIVKHSKVRLSESRLKAIVAESVKKVLNEISLSNYDNPSIRKEFMDGDEFSTDGVEYNPSVNPEYDDREERWDKLLSMRNRGLLSNEELDAIRDRFGY